MNTTQTISKKISSTIAWNFIVDNKLNLLLISIIEIACQWAATLATALIGSQAFLINFLTSLYNDPYIDTFFKTTQSFNFNLNFTSSPAEWILFFKVASIAAVIFSAWFILALISRIFIIIGISNIYYRKPLTQFSKFELWHTFKGILWGIIIPSSMAFVGAASLILLLKLGAPDTLISIVGAIETCAFFIFSFLYFFYGVFTLFIQYEDLTPFSVSFKRSCQLVSGAKWQIIRANILLYLRFFFLSLFIFAGISLIFYILKQFVAVAITSFLYRAIYMIFNSFISISMYATVYSCYKQLSAQQPNK